VWARIGEFVGQKNLAVTANTDGAREVAVDKLLSAGFGT
jgi:hypothetical protein